MQILLTGATGFIGSRLRDALLAAGHRLVCAGRRAGPPHPRCRWVAADFTQPVPWHLHLAGVDAVVNAVGLFRESEALRFDDLHVRGPQALFDACVAAGVARVVQVSALGADARAATAYHRSKRAADGHLLALPLDATVVMPSLVFGPEGSSTQGLLALAALPCVPLPAGGGQRVQPLHVDDAVAAIVALLHAPRRWRGHRVALVGPLALSLKQYLLALRAGLGLGRAPTLAVPASLVALAARLGEHWPGALLDRAAWQMLQRGNEADPADITTLLGRAPRPAEAFIGAREAPLLRRAAQERWLRPLLRTSLAAVWLATAAVSAGLYPVEQSHGLLARAGVPPALQPAALYGAAALDALLGLLTLAPLRPRAARRLWAAQALLIAGYTAVITLRLPEFWLHPYGPLTKNLPMLALLAWLWATERRK